MKKEKREMFTFLHPTTIGLVFLLLSIPAIISSNKINVLHSLSGMYFSIFLWRLSTSFEYSTKDL